MSRIDLGQILSGLKRFQRDTVSHVVDKFYGSRSQQHSGRFLVADETGLGKSVVARGVIAHTIHKLQQNPATERINIVYICSNQDLARQNLERLNVTENKQIAHATRLTLLATESPFQTDPDKHEPDSPTINLISFTPGTSFNRTTVREGSAKERALLVVLLLRIMQPSREIENAMLRIFQGRVQQLSTFANQVKDTQRQLAQGFNTTIQHEFEHLVQQRGLLRDLTSVCERLICGASLDDLGDSKSKLISELRECLATVSLEILQPHLVILDEFQRFKELLDPSNDSSAAELAQKLFAYNEAKVLLLSATPYHPFTTSERGDGEHERDFFKTIEFLTSNDTAQVQEIQQAFRTYRNALATGEDTTQSAGHIRLLLLDVMTRSERPVLVGDEEQIAVKHLPVEVPTPAELTEWVTISEIGRHLRTPVNIEYWKSIPHLMNFINDYRWGKKITEQLEQQPDRELISLLRKSQHIRRETVTRHKKIDAGNGKLRALAAETIDRGWWKLLWVPPSMPYLEPGPIYSQFSDHSVTKHVVFSAWSATPKAIAAVLSHEAQRHMRNVGVRGLRTGETLSEALRFTYARREEHLASSLSTLAIFWPHPGLLTYADQLAAAREHGGRVPPRKLTTHIADQLPPGEQTRQVWEAFFAHPGAFEHHTVDVHFALELDNTSAESEDANRSDSHQSSKGLRANIEHAREYFQQHQGQQLSHPQLPSIIAFSPGSVAYRAVSAIAGPDATPKGVWRAAFTIAEAIRLLFNRPDTQDLIDQLTPKRESTAPYWHKVLNYCADGNLRAVLDEYLYQLWSEGGQASVDDNELNKLAAKVASALDMRHASYTLHDPVPGTLQPRISTHFAVPYAQQGTASAEERSAARLSSVRETFNSPFVPFVLASTSIGQEGIDFHWWSHSVIHWNMPSNPVDFEQREGRVNRFAGLAVRRNVADAHWQDVLDTDSPNAWQAAFEVAEKNTLPHEDFAPWWVYPGATQIQRVLMHFPMSRDIEKYERLRSALSNYRLTLGQPRQSDLLDLIAKHRGEGPAPTTIDLRPPRFH